MRFFCPHRTADFGWLHSTLHSADFPRVAKCIVCASNYTQTIHKLYIKPYIEAFKPYTEAFKTLHSERSEPYTASVRKTIHEAVHKPYILFLNTNLANGI